MSKGYELIIHRTDNTKKQNKKNTKRGSNLLVIRKMENKTILDFFVEVS